MILDDSARDLAESLNDMVDIANKCADFQAIEDVVEEMGHTCLQVASLIQEYTKLSSLSELSITDLFRWHG